MRARTDSRAHRHGQDRRHEARGAIQAASQADHGTSCARQTAARQQRRKSSYPSRRFDRLWWSAIGLRPNYTFSRGYAKNPIMLPSPYGSGLGLRSFHLSRPPRVHLYYGPATRLPSQRWRGRWASEQSVSLLPAIPATGLPIATPAGLTPAEHNRLFWTHFRTVSFPQYGFKLRPVSTTLPASDAQFKRQVRIRRHRWRFDRAFAAFVPSCRQGGHYQSTGLGTFRQPPRPTGPSLRKGYAVPCLHATMTRSAPLGGSPGLPRILVIPRGSARRLGLGCPRDGPHFEPLSLLNVPLPVRRREGEVYVQFHPLLNGLRPAK